MTADASPAKVMVGEPITVTIVVTNEFAAPITYGTIGAPEPFTDCGVEVGRLAAGESKTVTCTGSYDEPIVERVSFTIANAKGEHIKTKAENGAHVKVVPSDKPSPSESPSHSSSPSEPVPTTEEPTSSEPMAPVAHLPVTGSSMTPVFVIAAAGAFALALGIAYYRRYAART